MGALRRGRASNLRPDAWQQKAEVAHFGLRNDIGKKSIKSNVMWPELEGSPGDRNSDVVVKVGRSEQLGRRWRPSFAKKRYWAVRQPWRDTEEILTSKALRSMSQGEQKVRM